jgi:predicted HAD superfamily Cof-like phosphohydrolase
MSRLRNQVEVFMQSIQQATPRKPGVPSVAVLKLRGRLIIEEAIEFLEALYAGDEQAETFLGNLKAEVLAGITDTEPLTPDFPGMVDALGDILVVTEGSNIAFGVNGEKVLDEIMKKNMEKVSGPTDAHGKRQKPPGFTPPDIAQVLREQGWGVEPKDPRTCGRCGDTVGCGCMCH